MGIYYNDYYIIDEDKEEKILFNISDSRISLCRGSIDSCKKAADNSLMQKPPRARLKDHTGSSQDLLLGLTICSAETCNLRCKYCFANGGTYDQKDKKIMSFDDYKNMLEALLELFPEGIKGFCFFGGEPLLGFEAIKEFVPYAIKTFENRQLKPPIFTINTNGTLITPETADFFRRYKISVTVSIDGDIQVNDSMRVFPDGRGSYSIIKDNLELLKDRNYFLYAEATITGSFLENYREKDAREYLDNFYKLGFDNVAVFVADYKGGKLNSEEYLKKIQLFYKDIVDYSFEILQDESKARRIQSTVLSTIRNIITDKEKGICSSGKKNLLCTADGTIYPCQLFYQARQDSFGNLFNEGSSIKDKINNYKKIDRSGIEECSTCFAKKICSAWCEGSSLLFNGDRSSVIKTRCAIQKCITENIIRNLVKVKKDKAAYKNFSKNISSVASMYSLNNLFENIY